jgi:hypothetical protein
MDGSAFPAKSSSAMVLASAANIHEAASKYFENGEIGDLAIRWQLTNELGEIVPQYFCAHQDIVRQQSKLLAAKVQSEHQKRQRVPEWRRRDLVSLCPTCHFWAK